MNIEFIVRLRNEIKILKNPFSDKNPAHKWSTLRGALLTTKKNTMSELNISIIIPSILIIIGVQVNSAYVKNLGSFNRSDNKSPPSTKKY